ETDMTRSLTTICAAGLVLAAALSALSGAQAGTLVERPAPQRPSVAGGATSADLAKDFAVMLGTLVAAEIAAQDRLGADDANPFRKPRPRPLRDYGAKVASPAVAARNAAL
ncbi:MAG: hypothetical protein Q8Q62_19115, partial [Mesorhizobium sp.]|nr:hypothetical protein [Mesorhizobium sp.]